jgi:hypothetical protein
VDGLSSGGHGHLEILDQGGAWRRVCWDNWSQDNAMVACRQLRYKQLVNTTYDGELYAIMVLLYTVSLFLSAAQSTSSSVAVAVASTNCTGDEFHLQSCASFQFQQSNLCTSGQNVMLTCVGK